MTLLHNNKHISTTYLFAYMSWLSVPMLGLFFIRVLICNIPPSAQYEPSCRGELDCVSQIASCGC